ncbi:MAG TPA: FAD-binding oxidoreductase [Beijerinckiaceae bacterium]|jgi:glycine/D-amino acid oxidase-like deaminating enzyme
MDPDFGLWGATAEPAPATPPLAGDRTTDVAIVGAGYTGLSTALHLAEAGVSVTVIDAEHPGYGASGRNGGQVLPGFKTYPDHLIKRYGPERGGALAAFGAGLADGLFALIARHDIRCDARQSGWIHAGHHPSKLPEQRWKHDQWASRGARVRWLERDAMAELLGTEAYAGGWIDERGGSLQPLSFARGLARAAQAAGAFVHGGTRATALARSGDGWSLMTSRGTLRAGTVVVATNGYTGGLVDRLAATIVPVQSAQIASQVLGNEALAGIMPSPAAVSDTRRSLLYFRRSPDGRLVMGGRGGILFGTGEGHYARLRRAAEQLYPALAGARWEHRWAGTLAVTLDHMPHLHEPAPGLIASLGCNGRGVAYSTGVGRIIAERARGARPEELPVPLTPVNPMPMAPFRRIGAAAVAQVYGWRDRLTGSL